MLIDMKEQGAKQRNRIVFLDICIDGESAGRIVIELKYDVVPKTAENFRALCTGERGCNPDGKPLHYKGIKFHKAVSQFMVQSGDIINGNGTSGESIYGPSFEDENFILKHEAGVLSMANRGRPHTNGSQFCITTVLCPQLDGTNVVFGTVLAGLEVAEEMQNYSVDGIPLVNCIISDCGELFTLDWGLRTTDGLPEFPSDLVHLPPIPIEQLLASIKEVKSIGNFEFGRGRFKAAVCRYRKCMRFVRHVARTIDTIKDELMKYQVLEKIELYTKQTCLNLAACYMKLGDYKACASSCTQVLELDGRNEKALYRRGQANFNLKNYETALSDLRQVERLCPKNKAVQKLLEEVRISNKCYNDLQKQRLSKFFRDQKDKEESLEMFEN